MKLDQETGIEEFKAPSWARRAMLPPRYQTGKPISSAPMGVSADLIFDVDGNVAWDRIWDDFCDLALAGGPPHRETMLPFGTAFDGEEQLDAYESVVVELIRAVSMVTGWETRRAIKPGRFILVCPDEDAADWLDIAINAENVRAERSGVTLILPAGPVFTLRKEIRNVVTAVAKAHHYWAEHRESLDAIRRTSIAGQRESG